MQTKNWCWTSLALLLLACGSSSSSTGTTADPFRYDALAHDIATATSSYCDGHSWNGDVTACTAAESAHAHAVAPHLQEMAGMAADMDQAEHDAGRLEHMDCACTVSDMQAEIERHRAAACSGSAADREQEAARHCAAMMASAERMHDRAGELTHHADDWSWPSSGAGGAAPCADGPHHGM
jgi:hypothetical protein